MLSLELHLKLRKCVCARIVECEREQTRLANSKKKTANPYWAKELADCDQLMRWLDAVAPEITRPKDIKPSDLFREILSGQLGVTL